jgi:hypothetical protein
MMFLSTPAPIPDWYQAFKDFQTLGASFVALLAAVIAYRAAIRSAKVSADNNREQINAADSRIARERRDKELAYALNLTADAIILHHEVSKFVRRLDDMKGSPFTETNIKSLIRVLTRHTLEQPSSFTSPWSERISLPVELQIAVLTCSNKLTRYIMGLRNLAEFMSTTGKGVPISGGERGGPGADLIRSIQTVKHLALAHVRSMGYEYPEEVEVEHEIKVEDFLNIVDEDEAGART